jgi:hypothetical protein
VINLRRKSLVRTLAGLHQAGLQREAEALSAVMGSGNKSAWEDYARTTFLAHTRHVPAEIREYLANQEATSN